jgi:hypothetical protein
MQAFYKTTTAAKDIGSDEHRRKGTPNILLRQAFDAMKKEGLTLAAKTENITNDEGMSQYIHLWHFQDAEFVPGTFPTRVGQVYEVTASTLGSGGRQCISALLSPEYNPEVAKWLSEKKWAPDFSYLLNENMNFGNRVGWGGSQVPWFRNEIVKVEPVVEAKFNVNLYRS